MTVRLLHVNAGNLYGGIEAMLVTIAFTGDVAPGLEQRYAVSHEGRFSDELRAAGAEVHALGPARLSRPWTVWRARHRMRALVAGERFDVVACHGPWSLAVYGPAVIRTGARLWFWAHAPMPGRWLDRLALRTAPHLVLANSRFTLEHVQRLFAHETPSEVIHPSVRIPPAAPESERRAVRTELTTDPRDAVIICACRMERWKGVHLLVEALARLRHELGWTAWIAGGAQRRAEEAYVAELRRSAERFGIAERIRFLGQRSDVSRLLDAADIHCQPNVAPEPFGLAVADAMGHGLAVVTTGLGAVTEFLDPETAAFADPTPDAVARELLALVQDSARRTQLGSRARARARAALAPATVLAAICRVASRGLA